MAPQAAFTLSTHQLIDVVQSGNGVDQALWNISAAPPPLLAAHQLVSVAKGGGRAPWGGGLAKSGCP